jgi:hypothetical protein
MHDPFSVVEIGPSPIRDWLAAQRPEYKPEPYSINLGYLTILACKLFHK